MEFNFKYIKANESNDFHHFPYLLMISIIFISNKLLIIQRIIIKIHLHKLFM